MERSNSKNVDVSIIIPIHNGSLWIDTCFEAIINQSAIGVLKLEICVCNDASTDSTLDDLERWEHKFRELDIHLELYNNKESPGGVGYAKNKAVGISHGTYLCFQDVDDIMLPDRILKQAQAAKQLSENAIVGCKFYRYPPDSTRRYTKWANSLTQSELCTQIFTSNGPTVIMPTWFCNRAIFERLGGFCEDGKGTPEDLIFFYKHLNNKGKIHRVDEYLLVYTYHAEATTFSIHENTIWDIRVKQLELMVLNSWKSFTIWNAGKQGRKFYKSLSPQNKIKVTAFCDVDSKKIGKQYAPYDDEEKKFSESIEIVHFKQAVPPFVICVKMDLTGGAFENNLSALNLEEWTDYILFS